MDNHATSPIFIWKILLLWKFWKLLIVQRVNVGLFYDLILHDIVMWKNIYIFINSFATCSRLLKNEYMYLLHVHCVFVILHSLAYYRLIQVGSIIKIDKYQAIIWMNKILIFATTFQDRPVFVCKICGDSEFYFRFPLQKHIVEQHSQFGYKCQVCKKMLDK